MRRVLWGGPWGPVGAMRLVLRLLLARGWEQGVGAGRRCPLALEL